MDEHTEPAVDFVELATEGAASRSSTFAGAFFPQAQHVHVAAGTFSSNVHVYPVAQPILDEFKEIARWEIDLIREIRLNRDRGTVSRSGGTRRMFSAKIHNSESKKAVILYEGEKAQEEYHQYVSRHAGICHPNILQIFGVSNFSCKYAVIVQDDLLPYDVYLSLQRSSFILEIYLYAYWSTEFRDALKYILDCKGWTFWIRRLSGRLCIEIESSHINEPWLVDIDSVYDPRLLGYGGLAQLDWNNPKWDSTAVEFFTISQFHRIFGANLFNLEDIPADQDPADEVHLGTILLAPGDSEEVYEVAYLPAIKDNLSVWQCIQPGCRADIMDNGWTRFNSWDIYGEQISFHLSIGNTHQPLVGDIWIAQANHVFEQLRVTSGHNNYVFTYAVEFRSQNLLTSTSDPPHGYLFLCPLDHFQTGRNSFRLPDVFWFWSIDPTGQNFATEDQAVILGFPELRMQCPTYQGYCWDTRAYEGLAAFHAAKGFNPKSQDLAIHLGLPLYELCDPR